MADRPVLFSAPMVRALLAGTKTQTRRGNHVERLRRFGPITEFGRSDTNGYDWHFRDKGMRWHDLRHGDLLKYLPWQAGDRLYVRETWSHSGDHVFEIYQARMAIQGRVIYRADDDPEFPHAHYWPSIHMPREFSRLTLTVTDVRVQHLQDISAADAIGEGLSDRSTRAFLPAAYGLPDWPNDWCGAPRDAYRRIWESINGDGSWDDNPWVAAYSFTVERGNIDQLGSAV